MPRTFSLFPLRSLFLPLHRSVSVPRFGVERVSERNANTSIFNETTGDKENSLTTVMSTTARSERIYTHRYWPTFRPYAVSTSFPCASASLHSSGFMEGWHRRRFSPGRLDYLAEIRKRSFRKNVRYKFARPCNRPKMKPPFKYRENFNFRLFLFVRNHIAATIAFMST